MAPCSLPEKILRALKTRGLQGTFVFAKNEIRRRYRVRRSLDRIYGTDTSGEIPLSELNIPSESRSHGRQYQPIPTKVFNRAIAKLGIRYEEYTFVDFGSGKGRALLLASCYPFRRIIGVEFSPELNSTALDNIARYRPRKQRCSNIETICIDAARYVIPDEPTVYYFFNPFNEVIMRKVLHNIQDSIRRCPRDAYFVYYNPVCAHLFPEFGFYDRNKNVFIEAAHGNWFDF